MMPPDPMRRTLAALTSLPDGEELTLLLYREPFPLYALLDREGYVHATELERDGTYRIRIRLGR
ncbi:MAG: DUF2249 domain-containing protein [Archangiaceae bacterium]|nr:DUF2249 domain-containing protein [Archangiaceae bacterium]